MTPGQKQFFDTFGYLVFPGLLRADIESITAEFRAVFDDRGIAHDATKRTCVVPFIDQREKLCALLDHPSIRGIAEGISGENFNYIGSDGNYYTGHTNWHSDGYHTVGQFLKIALYLDSVTRESGALRVIPGSHRLEMRDWPALQAANAHSLWGIEPDEVPCVALESVPGDVVCFNHNLMHSSFGGSTQRRMFTVNLCRHAQSAQEITELKNYIAWLARFWSDQTHSDLMRRTADATRMSNLRQVIECEEHLPALAAQARITMDEPARA